MPEKEAGGRDRRNGGYRGCERCYGVPVHGVVYTCDLPRVPDTGAISKMLVRMCADGAQWADDRIASPQVHSTLAGLTDDDVALPDAKRGTIASFVALASNKLRFSKVVALKGLPISGSVRVVVDVKTPLKIRESDECRAF